MIKRKLMNIFIIVAILILVLVLFRTGMIEKAIRHFKDRLSSESTGTEENEEYPEHIYETFVDGDGNEVSVKMERKTGTLDGEEVTFYEDTMGSEVIYCNFYKGTIKSIENGNLIILVDTQCLNADLESSYYQYECVDEYERIFNIDNYDVLDNEELGFRDMISIDANEIASFDEINNFINKYVRIQDVEFKDNLTKKNYKGLNIFTN